MKKIIWFVVLSIGINTIAIAQNWTGKFALKKDNIYPDSVIFQIIPDVDGTDEIVGQLALAYLIVPDGLTYTTSRISGGWNSCTNATCTLGNVSDNPSGCGDLVEVSLNADHKPPFFQAGKAIDMFRLTITDKETCKNLNTIRLMGNPDACPLIASAGLEQAMTVGSNTAGVSGIDDTILKCEDIVEIAGTPTKEDFKLHYMVMRMRKINSVVYALWKASHENEVAGYRVWMYDQLVGHYVQLTNRLVQVKSYLDSPVRRYATLTRIDDAHDKFTNVVLEVVFKDGTSQYNGPFEVSKRITDLEVLSSTVESINK